MSSMISSNVLFSKSLSESFIGNTLPLPTMLLLLVVLLLLLLLLVVVVEVLLVEGLWIVMDGVIVWEDVATVAAVAAVAVVVEDEDDDEEEGLLLVFDVDVVIVIEGSIGVGDDDDCTGGGKFVGPTVEVIVGVLDVDEVDALAEEFDVVSTMHGLIFPPMPFPLPILLAEDDVIGLCMPPLKPLMAGLMLFTFG